VRCESGDGPNTLLTQLRTGEIDLWQAISGPLTAVAKGLAGKRSSTWLSNFMSAIYFNTSHKPVSDPRVRRAPRLATDRRNIFDKVMLRNGVMTESLIPVVNPDHLVIPLSKYDLGAAARMLGVIETGKFDAALLSQAVPLLFADIGGAYTCAGIAPHGANFVRYCDPKVDALNEGYVQTYDPRRRKAIAAQMQRLVDEDCPMIEIYERAFVSVYDARLTGYAPNPYSNWGDPLELDI
jgi:ABC-type transport system substrate-binding protein